MAKLELRLALGTLFMLGLLALFPAAFTSTGPWETGNHALSPPTAAHPFGSDALGRDTWSRLIHGTRTSLLVGMLATGFALLIGGMIGLAAGAVVSLAVPKVIQSGRSGTARMASSSERPNPS